MQPFLASKRLEAALKENKVDYKYFILEHSGHGMQNDSAVSKLWMEAVEEYLDKYMPVGIMAERSRNRKRTCDFQWL